jgi:hypothetical protein
MTTRRTWPTVEPEIIEQVRDPNPTVALRRHCHRDDSPSQARPWPREFVDKLAKDLLDLGNKPATYRTSEQISCRHGLAQGRSLVAIMSPLPREELVANLANTPMPEGRASARRSGGTSGHRGWLKSGKQLNAPRRTSRLEASPSTCWSVPCLPWNRASSVPSLSCS